MDAPSFFSSANLHYLNEEYEEALKHYTCAISLQEGCAEYLACRAACHLKLGKFGDAIEDADKALASEPTSHMAMHWKGIALFYVGDYAAAKLSFESSQRVCPSAKAPRALWIRKCDAELSGSTLPLGGIAVETSKVSTAGPAAVTPAPAPSKEEPAPEPAAPSTVNGSIPEADRGPAPAPPKDATISGRKPVRREWYQNNTHVMITLFIKGLERENCTIDFQERELSLAIKLPGSDGEEYHLDLELFDAVEKDACSLEVSKVKAEVKLAKRNIGQQWTSLEKAAEVLAAGPEQPAYPSSAKQRRDWSQIEHDIDENLKNEKPQGDEALNTLFKQIYERADDDTRRAMNKSFQTSGGTVLSTNWGEVARADYEGKDRPTPPEGQEWRDWRKGGEKAGPS